jgi:hypothetical protein
VRSRCVDRVWPRCCSFYHSPWLFECNFDLKCKIEATCQEWVAVVLISTLLNSNVCSPIWIYSHAIAYPGQSAMLSSPSKYTNSGNSNQSNSNRAFQPPSNNFGSPSNNSNAFKSQWDSSNNNNSNQRDARDSYNSQSSHSSNASSNYSSPTSGSSFGGFQPPSLPNTYHDRNERNDGRSYGMSAFLRVMAIVQCSHFRQSKLSRQSNAEQQLRQQQSRSR